MTTLPLCATLALAFCLPLQAEDLSLIGIDHLDLVEQAPVVPPADQRPSEEKDPECIASAPNAQGNILLCYRREDILNDALALLTPSGTIRYLYQYSTKPDPLVPPVTQEILWLSEKRFACVCSGKRNSFFALYHIEEDNDDNTKDTLWAYAIASGVLHGPVQWKGHNGKLEGFWYNRRIICIGE